MLHNQPNPTLLGAKGQMHTEWEKTNKQARKQANKQANQPAAAALRPRALQDTR
jgi:hypothetical protein